MFSIFSGYVLFNFEQHNRVHPEEKAVKLREDLQLMIQVWHWINNIQVTSYLLVYQQFITK